MKIRVFKHENHTHCGMMVTLGKVWKGLGFIQKNLWGMAMHVSGECILVLWRPNPVQLESWSNKQLVMNFPVVRWGSLGS